MNKFFKLFSMLSLLGILSMLFINCAQLSLQPVSKSHKFGKTYTISTPITTTVGSSMITIYNLFGYPAYTPKYKYQPPPAGSRKQFKVNELTPGVVFTALYKTPEGKYVIIPFEEHHYGIVINDDGVLDPSSALIDLSDSRKLVHDNWQLPDPQLFVKATSPTTTQKGSFKCELLYNGISGNTIQITYREYVDEMARPAFYQNLQYDLTEKKIIAFRSLKIEVISATNSEMIFQVLEDEDLPWVPRQ